MVKSTAKSVLDCTEASAVALYRHLQNRVLFDRGYREIDYQHSKTNPLKGKNDGKVVCEEIWETTLDTLDVWSVDGEKTFDFHTLHKLIETTVRRPVPWVLEAPYVGKDGGVLGNRTSSLVEVVEKEIQNIRTQIQNAIDKLKNDLQPLQNIDSQKYEEAFLIGLYAFVAAERKDQKLSLAEVKRIPFEAKTMPELASFLAYLAKEGGLGMWQKNMKDAPLEKMALETIVGDFDQTTGNVILNGWCTEQSKVLYAVLRMAGLQAGFIEPRLTINYFAKKGPLQEDIPLPAHIASGVKVEAGGKTWIMDMGMKMVRADYAADHDYWELSLRQYWMVDLSNIAVGQSKADHQEQATASYETALNMGIDSTAHHSFLNYFYILSPAGKSASRFCKNASDCLRQAFALYPYSPEVWFEIGRARHGNYAKALEAFLEAIDLDPRYAEAYEAIGKIGDRTATKNKKLAEDLKKRIRKGMGRIYKNHPLLHHTISAQLKACAGRREMADSTLFFKALADL
ncbi:MAG: hypothetical protein Q7T03_07345 [Deltaproteobacteria bacterium]|nr:hypothetical protein [Deltaproteobacteria bacterium]